MSDTPLTDEQFTVFPNTSAGYVPVPFAQRLEKTLNIVEKIAEEQTLTILKLQREHERISEEFQILLTALERIFPLAEYGAPKPSHDGPCVPDASCDSDCSAAHYASELLWDTRNIIERFKNEHS